MSSETLSVFEVAVPCPVPQTFTYSSSQKTIAVGSRVKVPFGPRKLVGLVTAQHQPKDSLWPSFERMKKIRPIIELVDETPVFSAILMNIGFWMSRYYCYPVGEVFASMLPASASKTRTETWTLDELGCEAITSKTSEHSEVLAFLFLNKKSLSSTTIRKRFKEAKSRGICLPDSLELDTLLDEKLLACERISGVLARRSKTENEATKSLKAKENGSAQEQAAIANKEQSAILQALRQDLIEEEGIEHSRRPFLLWGVTGSGKTEVYLQHISRLLASHPQGQILMLVPEISLTPQMTRAFSLRFPERIAVSHSKLSPNQRWQVWESLRMGTKSILISPRSGVFAPFLDLKLIIVDEEHDSSYKQNSKLQYNGRDLAVLRAKLEGAQCILGSATPSLESYQNGLSGRYKLLRLKNRARGAKLPNVKIVSPPGKKAGSAIISKPSGSQFTPIISEGFEPIATEIIDALSDNLEKQKQSIVLVNRRGYSAFLLDLEKKESVQCPSCSISLTLHRLHLSLKCHYCSYSTKLETLQRRNPQAKYFAFGYGSQKAEEYLSLKLPQARIARLDSDIANNRDHLTKTLEQFRCGETDILLGTQMLAKGHDFPGVALTVILDCDKMLNLPDFRAGERTFQLLVQAAGRAGRQEEQGQVLVQSVEEDHPVIIAGLSHDYESFATQELKFRDTHGYPPFARQILWEINSTNKESLNTYCDQVDTALHHLCSSLQRNQPERFKQLKILGPMTPSIEKIMARYRKMVLFTCRDISALQQIHEVMLREIPRPSGDIRLNVDVDPQSLL